jgi:hypothetical protein
MSSMLVRADWVSRRAIKDAEAIWFCRIVGSGWGLIAVFLTFPQCDNGLPVSKKLRMNIPVAFSCDRVLSIFLRCHASESTRSP